MKKKQRTYLGFRPIFIKHFLRGTAKSMPFGSLLDEITFGVIDEEASKIASEKIHKKLDEILKSQDQQEFDFAEILLALHVQTDVNEKIKERLKEIELSLRADDDSPFPEYFGTALEKVIDGNKEICDGIQKLSDEHKQQSLEHKQHSQELAQHGKIIKELIAKFDLAEPIKKAVNKIFTDILKEDGIPQWQWPEKLREITQRHQELLAKWQTVQSADPAVDKLRDKAHRMIEKGEYDKADKVLQDAIEIDRKAIQSQQEKLDERKLSMAQALASRAGLAETKLDYKTAIDLYREALDILPQNKLAIQILCMVNLGALYSTIADYKSAEPLIRQSLAIEKASFDPDRPREAVILSNLAQLLVNTDRLEEAEALYRRALAIDEASFGPDHPKMATRLNNLAQLLADTNRFDEAEPLMKRVLTIDEVSFGPDHPNIAMSLNNLAALLQATNRFDEAEPLMRRALAINEAFFGSDHPNVAIALNNLAQLLQATNRSDKAEPLMRQALAIDKASFGPDHPNVAIGLNNLARLLQKFGRLEEAEPLMKRQLVIILQLTRRTGYRHPHLKDAINSYGGLLTQMGYSKDEVVVQLKNLK